MAVTVGRVTQKKMTGPYKAYPVKTNVKVHEGAMVCIDSAGFAVTGAEAAGNKVVGVATESIDNTGGADGALWVKVEPGLFLLKATSITQAMVGVKMHLVDNETFDDVAGANAVVAGILLEFVSTTSGWIYIDPADNLL